FPAPSVKFLFPPSDQLPGIKIAKSLPTLSDFENTKSASVPNPVPEPRQRSPDLQIGIPSVPNATSAPRLSGSVYRIPSSPILFSRSRSFRPPTANRLPPRANAHGENGHTPIPIPKSTESPLPPVAESAFAS